MPDIQILFTAMYQTLTEAQAAKGWIENDFNAREYVIDPQPAVVTEVDPPHEEGCTAQLTNATVFRSSENAKQDICDEYQAAVCYGGVATWDCAGQFTTQRV